MCDICGDAESDRCISWAYSSADVNSGTSCECQWSGDICNQCLVMTNNNDLVCVDCFNLERDSERIHVCHHEWFLNVNSFRDRLHKFLDAEDALLESQLDELCALRGV